VKLGVNKGRTPCPTTGGLGGRVFSPFNLNKRMLMAVKIIAKNKKTGKEREAGIFTSEDYAKQVAADCNARSEDETFKVEPHDLNKKEKEFLQFCKFLDRELG
jgi:hypothetical protein